ncbi:MAG: lipoate-protein ligase B/lipoate synthase, partial [Actinobacteria bacterium]|nr:lipoate-protein ligase B/lipoate synthase [Actinomycetota bacterium]
MSLLRARWLGRMPYREAWDLQRAFHEGRASGRAAADYLLLLEHPPTYTIGTGGEAAHVLASPEELAGLGAEVLRVDRGGDVTYHGPGQLVGYPIVHLGEQPDVVAYVRRLEQVLIRALDGLGIPAWAEPGYTGVWTAQGKVAAIGVRTARAVTMHGFALNVSGDLGWFRHIVPCGLADRPVASVSGLAGRRVSLEEMVAAVVPQFAAVFGHEEVEAQSAAFTRGAGKEEGGFEVDRLVAAGAFTPQGRAAIPLTRGGRLPGEPARPEWMRVKADLGAGYRSVKGLVGGLALHTVCQEAGCPNIFECWTAGTATFLLLGDVCTRACSFCEVTTGRPAPLDPEEPARVAEAVARLGLRHAVLTSVDRDDLPDGGAGVFAATIGHIRERVPGCAVEVLVPDFKGDAAALGTVMAAGPEVLNHNLETVVRLQREVRTAASYGRSLALLARAKKLAPDGLVKSGLMVGLGESAEEVCGALADLRAVGVDVVTIGQYLRPTA